MKRLRLLITKYWTLLPMCALLVLMAFYAWALPFYEFPEDASGYTMETVQTEEDGFSLRFSYEDTQVSLLLGSGLEADDIQYYGLTSEGIAIMAEEHVASLTDAYLGSFLAVSKLQYADYDGNGTRDRLHLAARTDMEFSQGNENEGLCFGAEVYPLELLFHNRDTVQLMFQDQPLADTQILVTMTDGSAFYCTTDEDGYAWALGPKDAWAGFTVSYSDNQQDFYILSYQVEANSLFTARHLKAMLPFFLIVGISALGIAVCLILRRVLLRRVYGKDYGRRARGAGAVRRSFSWFMLVRWLVMLAAWVLVFYGGHIFGVWFDKISLPILSCGLENENQLVSGSCYYLANLDLLLGRSLGEILTFIASFLASVVLLGRTLCGFLCPMGLLQDVLHEVRLALRVEGVVFHERIYRGLALIKWTLVILMISLCFAGGKFCDFCPARSLSPAFAGFQVSLYAGGFMMIFVVVGGFFKRRLWCGVCPLGFLLGAFHRVSLFQVKKDCTACTSCGACYEACPMGIKTVYTEKDRARVTDWDCIFCGECVRNCPEDRALSITFCGKRIYTSSRKRLMRHYGRKRKKETTP